jgi:hypothetical protein
VLAASPVRVTRPTTGTPARRHQRLTVSQREAFCCRPPGAGPGSGRVGGLPADREIGSRGKPPGIRYWRKRTLRFFLSLPGSFTQKSPNPQQKFRKKGVISICCPSYLRRAKSRSVKKIIRCSGSAFWKPANAARAVLIDIIASERLIWIIGS